MTPTQIESLAERVPEAHQRFLDVSIHLPVDLRKCAFWKQVDKHLIDLFAGFAFPQLFEVGTSRSTVDFGIWDIFVGVAFYMRPLF